MWRKKTAILGAVLFAWQQTIAWVISKTGTLISFILGESNWKIFQVGYPVDTPTDKHPDIQVENQYHIIIRGEKLLFIMRIEPSSSKTADKPA